MLQNSYPALPPPSAHLPSWVTHNMGIYLPSEHAHIDQSCLVETGHTENFALCVCVCVAEFVFSWLSSTVWAVSDTQWLAKRKVAGTAGQSSTRQSDQQLPPAAGGTGSKAMFIVFLSTGEITGLLFPADLFGSFMSFVIFLEQCCWRTAGANGLMTGTRFSRTCWAAGTRVRTAQGLQERRRLPESSRATGST